VLGWTTRPAVETIIDAANSLQALDLVSRP
jgi:hypothetical protein